MNAMKQEAPERQEIEELLPWHAAGTLSRRDAQRVEEALARDPELARRYALVRDELGETIHLNETLGELMDGNFDEYGEFQYFVTVMGTPSIDW